MAPVRRRSASVGTGDRVTTRGYGRSMPPCSGSPAVLLWVVYATRPFPSLRAAEPALVGIRDCILHRCSMLASMRHPTARYSGITLAARHRSSWRSFTPRPLALLGGYAVGVALAAATRRPWAFSQTVFEIARFAVFAPIGIWVFHLISGTRNHRCSERFRRHHRDRHRGGQTGDLGKRRVPASRTRLVDRRHQSPARRICGRRRGDVQSG